MTWPQIDQVVPTSFFSHWDTLSVAQQLIGKEIVTRIDGVICSAIISETEAYLAPEDKASHAYNNRKTKRTQVFYENGGFAYVYLCYGIHKLFNVITGPLNIPNAVLIRGGVAKMGVDQINERLQKPLSSQSVLKGSGVFSKAMGIDLYHTGLSVSDLNSPILILKENIRIEHHQILTSSRIGIDYSGEWAAKQWRFYIEPSLILKQLTI
jgi:DNA-3-methyladenine glycosylase